MEKEQSSLLSVSLSTFLSQLRKIIASSSSRVVGLPYTGILDQNFLFAISDLICNSGYLGLVDGSRLSSVRRRTSVIPKTPIVDRARNILFSCLKIVAWETQTSHGHDTQRLKWLKMHSSFAITSDGFLRGNFMSSVRAWEA